MHRKLYEDQRKNQWSELSNYYNKIGHVLDEEQREQQRIKNGQLM